MWILLTFTELSPMVSVITITVEVIIIHEVYTFTII